MKKALCSVGLAAVATFVLGADAQTEIREAYKQMDKLFGARDADGLKRFMQAHTTATFYSTAGGQKFNLDQNMAQVAPLLKQATAVTRPPTTVYSIVLSGTHATAKVSGSFTAHVAGRDGKPHTMSGGGKATDHWVKQSGKWLIEKTESYDNKFIVDGRSMQSSARKS